MHICEQVIHSAKFLKENGFSEKQLSSIHHFSLSGRDERYSSLLKYFGVNKNLRERNEKLANRISFIAEQYKQKNGSFSQLIEKALLKWPLS